MYEFATTLLAARSISLQMGGDDMRNVFLARLAEHEFISATTHLHLSRIISYATLKMVPIDLRSVIIDNVS